MVSLGAVYPHPQLNSYLDLNSLAREPSEPMRVCINIEVSATETDYLKSVEQQIALELLRGQLARNDEQSQLALAQYLSSQEGTSRLKLTIQEVNKKIEALQAPVNLPIQLTIDGAKSQISGADPFNHTLIMIFERRCPREHPNLAKIKESRFNHVVVLTLAQIQN